ncbi:MAG: response regulator transcription factor [Sulfurospirillaceae bacterium]|nr:response regulator transcription factor [Sulfurospirillaceae bacterium]MDD2825338.1 response regulator transcription factor [Sulfurospirillaceae bacterium]
MRILILEDNVRLASGLKKILTKEGYAVDILHDGTDGANVLDYQAYDLLLLDLGLPGMDGIDILKEVRKNNTNLPVIIISARHKLDQRILGFDMGADDYISKPFDLAEVVVRVRALLRRSQQKGQATIQLGELVFNTTTRELSLGNERILLSKRELAVFEYLVSQENIVISKENIADHIGNFDDGFSSHAIETYISRLRKKLGLHVDIKTFPGLGYMIHTK